MRLPPRFVLPVGLGLAVILLVVALRWRGNDEARNPANPPEGWPAQVSMTCTACSKVFDLPSSEYVAKMNDLTEDGKGPFACPACSSHDVVRSENLKHDRRARTRKAPPKDD